LLVVVIVVVFVVEMVVVFVVEMVVVMLAASQTTLIGSRLGRNLIMFVLVWVGLH
jgi:hypothetical protein